MPGPVSDSCKGPRDDAPYLPSWCYRNGPKTCPCGHHEGCHRDDGACLLAARCGCRSLPVDPVVDRAVDRVDLAGKAWALRQVGWRDHRRPDGLLIPEFGGILRSQ